MELLIPAIDSAKKLFVAWFTGMKMEKIRTIIKEQKNKCKKTEGIYHNIPSLHKLNFSSFPLKKIKDYSAHSRIFIITLPNMFTFLSKELIKPKTDFNVGQIRLWHFEFGATRFATGIRNINGGKKFTTQSQAHSPVKKTAFVTYEVRIITTVIVSSYVIYIGRI